MIGTTERALDCRDVGRVMSLGSCNANMASHSSWVGSASRFVILRSPTTVPPIWDYAEDITVTDTTATLH
jgi:hypothetical protein